MTASDDLLLIDDLFIDFAASTGTVHAVRGASLTVHRGETVAIVGESGSGKSTLAHAIVDLLPANGRVTAGSIRFEGEELTTMSRSGIARLRGRRIGLVPQDPMSNLNPVWSIGFQVGEALAVAGDRSVVDGRGVVGENGVVGEKGVVGDAGGAGARVAGRSRRARRERVAALLTEVGLPDAAQRARQYPHEFSGGMRQRTLIAMGLAARPALVIADEPTSALDVTVQKRILDRLGTLTSEMGTAVLLITHDLGLAAERAEYVAVMYRGEVVEAGPALTLLRNPRHPYTQRLIAAAPSLSALASIPSVPLEQTPIRIAEPQLTAEDRADHVTPGATAPTAAPVLQVCDLVKEFAIRGARPGSSTPFRAVDNVSFEVARGTTAALVGESGSGKTTVAEIVLGLQRATSGRILFDGRDVAGLDRRAEFAFRRRVQPVFQDPYGSLDPMYTIFRIIDEPLRVHRWGGHSERLARVREVLEQVALPESMLRRYPAELSGGQRQRVAVARALALKPELLVCDEAVSALDVLVQAQILDLLADLQRELGLTYLFITHDLAVVRQVADWVCVMQAGRIVEQAPTGRVFAQPEQEYTRQLLDAIPGAGLL